jgi:hypothetical protein
LLQTIIQIIQPGSSKVGRHPYFPQGPARFCLAPLDEGDKVTYEEAQGRKGMKAQNVSRV